MLPELLLSSCYLCSSFMQFPSGSIHFSDSDSDTHKCSFKHIKQPILKKQQRYEQEKSAMCCELRTRSAAITQFLCLIKMLFWPQRCFKTEISVLLQDSCKSFQCEVIRSEQDELRFNSKDVMQGGLCPILQLHTASKLEKNRNRILGNWN